MLRMEFNANYKNLYSCQMCTQHKHKHNNHVIYFNALRYAHDIRKRDWQVAISPNFKKKSLIIDSFYHK